jgi:hypothetical protein
MSIPLYPPSISTCILWLDASDPATLTVSGGRATAWKDKSQYSNDTRVVSAQGPLLSNINSISSLFFQGASGSAQFFQGPLSSFALYSTSLSTFLNIFAVGTVATTSVSGFFPNFVGTGFRTRFYPGTQLVQWSTIEANIAVFPHATSNSNYAPIPNFNEPFIVGNSAIYDATKSYTFLNLNGSPITRSDGTNTLATLTISSIGAYALGGSLSATTDFRNSWTGHIAEVLIYNTSNQITWNQRQLIEGYLASKWGIQSSLPPFHPYKNKPTFLSSFTSALYPTSESTTRNMTLPVTDTISTQLFWSIPPFQQSNMSSVAYVANSNQFIDANPSVQLNQTGPLALLVNNRSESNWFVHSISKNNLLYTTQNVPSVPYTQYPRAIGRSNNQPGLGFGVAISSNGNYIVAGDPEIDYPGASVGGGLMMFIRNAASDLYSTSQVYLSSGTTVQVGRFGQRVAMSDDATYVVGTSSNLGLNGFSEVGYASIFKKSPTTDYWTYIQRLDAPVSDQRRLLDFGRALAMTANGDYIFIGGNPNYSGVSSAGAVYPFKKSADTDYWSILPTIYPPTTSLTMLSAFGGSIAITADAGYLMIGASNTTIAGGVGAGSAFFYTKDAATDMWNFKQQLLPSDIGLTNYFGYAVALSRNSNYFVGTTPLSNTYVYKKQSTTDYWLLCSSMYPYSPSDLSTIDPGMCCTINEDGNYILVSGGSNQFADGTCFFYQKQTGTDKWQLRNFVNPINPATGRYRFWGWATAMTPSGDKFVVGCPDSNYLKQGIYVFQQSTIGVVNITKSYNLMSTLSTTKTLLLPHPATNAGQMIYIKDSTNNAINNPIYVSTTGNSFINSTIYSFSFLQNGAALQLQSDGINQYTLVNYYNGTPGFQPNSYEFRSFWVRGSTAGPVYNYPIPIAIGRGTAGYTIPYDQIQDTSIFFLDSDNLTPLPFWNEYRQPSIRTRSSNLFWVKLSYVPAWPMARQFFLYWNSNQQYQDNPNDVFPFFDDFSGGNGAPPDSNKWFVTKNGSSSGVAILNGFTDSVTLMGVSNTSANTGLLTKNAFLSTNFSIGFTATYSASTFATVSFGTTSNLQFLTTGGQSNWWWSALGNGYTLAFSSINRRFAFDQPENGAPVTLGCNTSGWALATTYRYEFTYLSNGGLRLLTNSVYRVPTTVFTFTDTTFLTSNKYVFFGQGSISNLAARSTILESVFVRPYVLPQPFLLQFNNLNSLE